MSDERPLIVAIDGPGGVGKSTVARRLARSLSIPYLETGAMYRALGYEVVSKGADPEDEREVARLAAALDLRMERLEDGSLTVLLNDEPLGNRARDERVGQVTSRVATYPQVRRRMVELQRRVGRELGGVIEGRDIGTKVFPDAVFKFFLEADAEVRAERRHREISHGGTDVSLESVRREMVKRDKRDSERADSPLRKDDSYVTIDTTELNVDEVVARMLEVIEARRGKAGRS